MNKRNAIGIALTGAVVLLGTGAAVATAHPGSVPPAQSPPAADAPEAGDVPDLPGQ